MKINGKIELKVTTDEGIFVTVNGTSYKFGEKSAPYEDRFNEGDEVMLDVAGNLISFIGKQEGETTSTSKGSFMDDYITHEQLLDKATGMGLMRVEQEIYHCDFDKGTAVVIAKAMRHDKESKQPLVFYGIGDATQKNVNSNIAPHFLRMASTRAVNRALRLLCNVGKTSKEELGGKE